MGHSVRISGHAARRFQERVDQHASLPQAYETLGSLSQRGRSRPTPRHWMRETVNPESGLLFFYPVAMPNICLLVRSKTVVTVLTRDLITTTRSSSSDERSGGIRRADLTRIRSRERNGRPRFRRGDRRSAKRPRRNAR
jgi:hypothetical protein